ncbi:unnamed protein product [Orchesella dallaii]|uniref:Uncharacterized protein n=1 Tax=Orchesella dallaii TaxID=48710 RepID=A0ABP1QF75_9HEXA
MMSAIVSCLPDTRAVDPVICLFCAFSLQLPSCDLRGSRNLLSRTLALRLTTVERTLAAWITIV